MWRLRLLQLLVCGGGSVVVGQSSSPALPPLPAPPATQFDVVAAMCAATSAEERMALVERVFDTVGLVASYGGNNTLTEPTCATNADHQQGFYIVYEKTSGIVHASPIYFHPVDAMDGGALVEMDWVLQGSDEVNFGSRCSNAGYWIPLNGPGFDGGYTHPNPNDPDRYQAPCPFGYNCTQGKPQNLRDAPVNASYSDPSFDSSTQILAWSGSTSSSGQCAVVPDEYTCACSPLIPTNKTALWFTRLTYTTNISPPPPLRPPQFPPPPASPPGFFMLSVVPGSGLLVWHLFLLGGVLLLLVVVGACLVRRCCRSSENSRLLEAPARHAQWTQHGPVGDRSRGTAGLQMQGRSHGRSPHSKGQVVTNHL